MTKEVDVDNFARAIEDIFTEIALVGGDSALKGVQAGIRTGAKAWREDARKSIGEHTYKRSGEIITSGNYAKSIRSHLTSRDEMKPAGEIGSPKMPGLTHLLEKGHARIGGGRVKPVLHIADDVAPAAFNAAIEAVENALADGFR